MMTRGILLASLLTLLLTPALSHAQTSDDGPESAKNGTFELKLGSYSPNIDDSVEGGDPFEQYFGGGGLTAEVGVDYHLWQDVGAVSIGFHLGYFNQGTPSLNADGSESADTSRLLILPTRLSAVYRFDYLQDKFDIPIVLSFRAGLDYYFWWALSANKVADTQGSKGSGGTAGWHVGGTFYFLLDVLAPQMARSLDQSTGINNSYIFAEIMSAHIDDFGSDTSWDLSDNTFLFGLGFEF
jgi:hypothetical protein